MDPNPRGKTTPNRQRNRQRCAVQCATEITETDACSRVKVCVKRTKSAKASLNSLMVSSDRSWVALRMAQGTDGHNTSHSGKTSLNTASNGLRRAAGTSGVKADEQDDGGAAARSEGGAGWQASGYDRQAPWRVTQPAAERHKIRAVATCAHDTR